MTELQQQIMSALKGHDSQSPMRLTTLMAHFASTSLSDMHDALEGLVASKLINRAKRTQGLNAWEEAWPTGLARPALQGSPAPRLPDLPRPPGTLSPSPPAVAPEAPDPGDAADARKPAARQTPTPKKSTKPAAPKAKGYAPRGNAAVMVGIIRDFGPLLSSRLAKAAGVPVNHLEPTLRAALKHGVVHYETHHGRGWWMLPGEQQVRFAAMIVEQIEDAKEAQADGRLNPAPQQPAQEPQAPQEPPPAVRQAPQYLLGDDASLTIIDDDTVLRLDPADLTRLARFLARADAVIRL